ncbi:hypothetical protein HOLleu_38258 [Holothuria leucospilota]|uniref:Sulfotransferase n=1 Tax=Holothuria leucospilota TaxID=206669 RepID=A0A9Q0YKN4_HOLLE|nr:hypothetical protein HOLleu_38258 [Holothuria leucospilota]
MTLRQSRIYRSLSGNSILKHFLLGLVLLSLPIILCMTNHLSHLERSRQNSRTSREYLVNWQPSLNDTNVSFLLEEHRNVNRPLIFVPFRHTGDEFFSFVIKQTISDQHLYVKVFDLIKSGKGSVTKKAQEVNIQNILRDESKDQLIFIESNVINLTIQTFDKEPLLVSIIRDPFEVLLSCYHQKKYGKSLYRVSDTFTATEFKDRLNNLTYSLEKCVLRNKHCTKGLLGSMSMVKSFSGMPLPRGEFKRDWANKAMPQAKTNIVSHRIVVGIIEDFHVLPFMFERIAPKVCQNLWYLFDMHQMPPWAYTPANISDRVKTIIKENDLHMLLEHRFYNWVKARYDRSKKFGFSLFIE